TSPARPEPVTAFAGAPGVSLDSLAAAPGGHDAVAGEPAGWIGEGGAGLLEEAGRRAGGQSPLAELGEGELEKLCGRRTSGEEGGVGGGSNVDEPGVAET